MDVLSPSHMTETKCSTCWNIWSILSSTCSSDHQTQTERLEKRIPLKGKWYTSSKSLCFFVLKKVKSPIKFSKHSKYPLISPRQKGIKKFQFPLEGKLNLQINISYWSGYREKNWPWFLCHSTCHWGVW